MFRRPHSVLVPLSLVAVVVAAMLPTSALADPCGMVPPIYIEESTPIARVGDQHTYVFFQDGIETFVIRPGFTGKVEDFGMLIPFPSPPAVRKVPEHIFGHVSAAIDPPEVIVDLRYGWANGKNQAFFKQSKGSGKGQGNDKLKLLRDQVRVISEEAVGMYEVAVLEAGSAAALKRWMSQHKYKYPDGMDKVAEEYVAHGWCFVAVKTKVGGKSGVDPRPGQRVVNDRLPSGSAFDGHVQAMGFRFKTEKLVVPMRLSAFNDGEMHNVVYLLTDGPRRIRSIPEEYVVRQVSGEELFRHVTSPLPLRIIGGTAADIPTWRRKNLPAERNPTRHNGAARDLFASDLLTVASGRLSHPYEEQEKMLLRIGERFGLRGAGVDKLNLAAVEALRKKLDGKALEDLKKMTLTVIDGDFPREVLADKNLTFGEYKMPGRRNRPENYNANTKKPSTPMPGMVKFGKLEPPAARGGEGATKKVGALRRFGLLFGLSLALAGFGLLLSGTRRPEQAQRSSGEN